MVDGARRWGVAAHPAVVASLVVLVVNDRVLKSWSGGVDGPAGTIARTMTGKASDVAGVLLLAVLLGVLTGRRRGALLAVAAGFTALKLSPAVADLAVPVLGGRTRTDPWDLLALAALAPADRLLRRLDLPAPDLRPVWASARATLGLAVVVVSVPAMTATSCPDTPTGLNRAGVLADGRVVAWGQKWDSPDPFARTRDWWSSPDEGRRWGQEELTDDERRELRGVAGRAEDELDEPVCTPSGCVRHGHDATIEEGSETGGWTTSFAYSDAERTAMTANETACRGELNPGIGTIVEVDGTVVATAGVFGVVRRAPGGDWEQVSVGEWERPGDLPSAWPRHLVWSPLPALALFVVLFWATLTRSPGRSFLRPFGVFLALLGAILLGGPALAVSVLGADARQRGVVVGVATAVVLAVALLPLAWLLIWPKAATPPDEAPPGPPGVRPGPDRREPPPPPGPSGWL
ncbi:MAG TPA: hypothetical protein VF228_12210 [Iamia sp.]